MRMFHSIPAARSSGSCRPGQVWRRGQVVRAARPSFPVSRCQDGLAENRTDVLTPPACSHEAPAPRWPLTGRLSFNSCLHAAGLW